VASKHVVPGEFNAGRLVHGETHSVRCKPTPQVIPAYKQGLCRVGWRVLLLDFRRGWASAIDQVLRGFSTFMNGWPIIAPRASVCVGFPGSFDEGGRTHQLRSRGN
jgi:hypothetical protein